MGEQPPIRPLERPPERKPQKPIAQALDENAPWKPEPWSDADAGALQALRRGDAPPHLQMRALQFIMALSGMSKDPYRVNPTDTAYACGRQYVGRQVQKLLDLDLAKLAELERERGIRTD